MDYGAKEREERGKREIHPHFTHWYLLDSFSRFYYSTATFVDAFAASMDVVSSQPKSNNQAHHVNEQLRDYNVHN